MICSACGHENGDMAAFCYNCGSRLNQVTSSVANNYGKEKCKLLRQVRKTIAELNDIDITFEECKHEGFCLGTCPLCESELSLLNQELERKKLGGEQVFLPDVTIDKENAFPKEKSPASDVEPVVLMGMPVPIQPFKAEEKKIKRFPWSK